MKTWPVLFALIVAGTCGAQAVVADLAKARSPFESDNGGTWLGLDDLRSGSSMKQLVQGAGRQAAPATPCFATNGRV